MEKNGIKLDPSQKSRIVSMTLLLVLNILYLLVIRNLESCALKVGAMVGCLLGLPSIRCPSQNEYFFPVSIRKRDFFMFTLLISYLICYGNLPGDRDLIFLAALLPMLALWTCLDFTSSLLVRTHLFCQRTSCPLKCSDILMVCIICVFTPFGQAMHGPLIMVVLRRRKSFIGFSSEFVVLGFLFSCCGFDLVVSKFSERYETTILGNTIFEFVIITSPIKKTLEVMLP